MYINEFKLLTSLEGCPEYVGGRFEMAGCHSLKSLEGMPAEVEGVTISNCNSLKSLKGMSKVKNYIDLSIDGAMRTLEGCPDRCKSFYLHTDSDTVRSLKGMPKEVDNNINLSGHIYSLEGMPENFKGILDIHSASMLYSLEFCPESVSKVIIQKYQVIEDTGVVPKSKLKTI